MNFTDSQTKAIESKATDILVIAGPGSGKTRTVVARIIRLIESGVFPVQIVAITFTNAAAAEIEKRLAEGMAQAVKLAYCGTIHGFLLRLLNSHGHLSGFAQHVRLNVLDEPSAADLLNGIAAEQNYRDSMDDLREILKTGSLRAAERPTKAELIVSEYLRRLKQMNMLCFDSILIYGREMLRSLPLASLTCNGQHALTHLFLDEAQDCGPLDWDCCRLLPIDNKFTVADPDQSIYGFRGGDVRFVVNHAKSSKVQVIALEENFRSGRIICEQAQNLIENNTQRVSKKTLAVRGGGKVMFPKPFPNPNEEANFITGMIREQRLDWNDTAILVRTNPLVQFFTDVLRGAGFPVAHPEHITMPLDWVRCRLALQLLTSPSNDFIALKWLAMTQGEQAAREIGRNAGKAMQSVNRFHLKFPASVNLQLIPAYLAKFLGISEESVARVQSCIEKIPIDSSVNDLLLSLKEEQFRKETVGTGTVITTIHSAKGREWTNVFLPALEDECIPGQRKSQTAADIEEERRLFYVGMTRGKELVVLSCALSRLLSFGPKIPQARTPSRFIREATEI